MRLLVTDLIIVFGVVVGAYAVRYRWEAPSLVIPTLDGLVIDYRLVCVVLIAAWLVMLSVFDTRNRHIIGSGSAEYSRVGTATLLVFGMLALVALAFKMQPSRGFLLMTFIGGMGLLLISRWLWRKWLTRQREKGHYLHRVVLVGSHENCQHTARRMLRDQSSGYHVVGVITDGTGPTSDFECVPLLGYCRQHETVDLAEANGADTIVYVGSDLYDPKTLRELGWAVGTRRMGLMVSPGLTDIAGPRISTRAVSGLPLLQVDSPQLEGWPRFLKLPMDVVGSSLLLAILSPLFLVIAVAVHLDSPGPIIFRQPRVGFGGKSFKMLKFRSMVTNAEAVLPTLLDQSEGTGVLFKMRNDPRVTRVGRFLRRYSLDELPQLVNVLRNDMSLVGPRPPLQREVDNYDSWAHRRLMVKPGITGLWQVSGRSELSWEDSLRLDLFYVENWSLMGDVVILWRTVRAIRSANGAW
jgi:exopolysaccharide biosynthesis polyprenyl glycosylphosphotransferase